MGFLLVFEVGEPSEELDFVGLGESCVLSVGAFEDGVPTFEGVGGAMDGGIHQVMEHIGQGVVDESDGS